MDSLEVDAEEGRYRRPDLARSPLPWSAPSCFWRAPLSLSSSGVSCSQQSGGGWQGSRYRAALRRDLVSDDSRETLVLLVLPRRGVAAPAFPYPEPGASSARTSPQPRARPAGALRIPATPAHGGPSPPHL